MLRAVIARAMLPVLAGAALLGGGLLHTAPAGASAEWCFDDPIVYINGVQQSITVGLPRNDVNHLSGDHPVVVTLHAPKNATIVIPPADQQPQGAFPVQTVVLYDKGPQDSVIVVQMVTSVTASTGVTFQVDLVNGNGVHTVKTKTVPDTLSATFTPKR